MPITQNWLGRQDLQLLQSLTQVWQEVCDTEEDLFEKYCSKFKQQYNETIKSLEFHELMRQANENVAIECSYKEIER